MIHLFPANTRGKTSIGWLTSYHTFSFGDYRDPERMGFSVLRVLNDDLVAPEGGFPEHPHRNMEIISYVISGELAHRDSMGNQSVIKAGHFQAMSAGKGVLHSEFNPSASEPVHFIQIWILPSKQNLVPSYSEWLPGPAAASTPLLLVGSGSNSADIIKINQDVLLYRGKLAPSGKLSHQVSRSINIWIQMLEGSLSFKQQSFSAGDGIALTEESLLDLIAGPNGAHFLLFELP